MKNSVCLQKRDPPSVEMLPLSCGWLWLSYINGVPATLLEQKTESENETVVVLLFSGLKLPPQIFKHSHGFLFEFGSFFTSTFNPVFVVYKCCLISLF